MTNQTFIINTYVGRGVTVEGDVNSMAAKLATEVDECRYHSGIHEIWPSHWVDGVRYLKVCAKYLETEVYAVAESKLALVLSELLLDKNWSVELRKSDILAKKP